LKHVAHNEQHKIPFNRFVILLSTMEAPKDLFIFNYKKLIVSPLNL